MSEKTYTAKEVAEILQKEGHSDISKRTVNYYAFDKTMFDIKQTGKNCFAETEINKIRAIKLLQKHTNMTLNQIKTIVNTHSLDEIKQICLNRTLDTVKYYSQGNQRHASKVFYQIKANTKPDSIPKKYTASLIVDGQYYNSDIQSDLLDDVFEELKKVVKKHQQQQNILIKIYNNG